MWPERGGIAVVRCAGCGLVHATAGYAPRFLDAHYTDRAARASLGASTGMAPRPGSERKRQALALYDRLTGGKLCAAPSGAVALDVGCGQGMLLDLLREAGWQTVGIERSGAAAAAIDAGHRVHAIDVEDPDERTALDERFDVITMTHVLEHLRNPVGALRWIASHLREDGLAVVEVPNWEDLARPLWGARYRPLELGDHLSFFERRTLTDLAERADLRVRTLWSAAQARTLLFPSLLTGLDTVAEGLRALRGARRAKPSNAGVGVASQRVTPGAGRLRHAAVTAALSRLDRLDPLLESLSGTGWARGANLVAVLERPR